jgi:AraC-like DNA-binding protein
MDSLDSETSADELARRAYRSRSNFYRLFQALIAENPGRMRRRILLERAAWQLASGTQPVTGIALDAGYGSIEAFARAFGRAYGASPSLYRRSGSRRIHLPAPNDFHYCPPNSSLKGTTKPMDLFDLFSGADSWYTRRLLNPAQPAAGNCRDYRIRSESLRFDLCA